MHPALRKLSQLEHQERNIIGLMSGTSLDGLDIALCKVSGANKSSKLEVIKFESVAYSESFLSQIKSVFAHPEAPLKKVNQLNVIVAREHAKLVNTQLAKWQISANDIDILASHGQTIFHSPRSILINNQYASATLQIGDGDHLAFLTQILTLSDFRQKHVAAMGEGAPLVPYADFLMFSSPTKNRILLNIGGIANFTYLPANCDFNEVISADTGPGNTLMDQYLAYVNRHNSKLSLPRFDEAGKIASVGQPDPDFLEALLRLHGTHNAQSTGQEVLNISFVQTAWKNAYPELDLPCSENLANIMATLNLLTATTIANAIKAICKTTKIDVYVSGGGAHNLALMDNLAKLLDSAAVYTFDELGVSADAKEAALFAILANQCLFGNEDIFANTRNIPATSFGKISLP